MDSPFSRNLDKQADTIEVLLSIAATYHNTDVMPGSSPRFLLVELLLVMVLIPNLRSNKHRALQDQDHPARNLESVILI